MKELESVTSWHPFQTSSFRSAESTIFELPNYAVGMCGILVHNTNEGSPGAPSSKPIIRIVETDGEVVELAATTAKGEITVITGMTKEGDTLILQGMHIDGPGAGSMGLRELRSLATELGKQQGAKQVTIFGGTRTTGANPGKVPRPITFPVGD